MKEFKLIFWDFDGVIKDSVEVKTEAYYSLFEPFGLDVAEKVRIHHKTNGGMSRFDKIPIYLEWAGVEVDVTITKDYCDKFSRLVLQAVIDSPWVPGVEAYLRKNIHKQFFVLVSATPQNELECILRSLSLLECFSRICGSPTSKRNAIFQTLKDFDLEASKSLMIGDSVADLEAAEANRVPFLLRKNKSNDEIFSSYSGSFVRDFSDG